MNAALRISLGQCSDKGRKSLNQDFHGHFAPEEPQLSGKGIALAVADGISSSDVSHIASQAAVRGFLADYFCTSEAWSVKKSAQRVLQATNAWLYAQTRHGRYCYDLDRGYVCTFSAVVFKSATAHLFHVGDTRIYCLRGGELEQLTHDHRQWVSSQKSYLSRAMGIDSHLEIDYQTLPLEVGDVFLLASDGLYEFVDSAALIDAIEQAGDDLQSAAQSLLDMAYSQGSDDNLTLQIARIDSLPRPASEEFFQAVGDLPFPPQLAARMSFDGYRIVRELHASSRSHVHLALDEHSGRHVVLKTPSIDLRGDSSYLERFMMEDWIARRLDSPFVLKAATLPRKRNYLYLAMEYAAGQTLKQWMTDHPAPDLATVRDIVEQLAKGLRAFHRMEMLHQDLRPDNVMIDAGGSVKIIDFGSTRVAGVVEMRGAADNLPLGTAQYSAPEYFLGETADLRADLFSLGVIAYQLLSGQLPYGAEVAKSKTRAAQYGLSYRSLRSLRPDVPAWVDDAIRKALQPNPALRYQALSEFLFDLHHPNPKFLQKNRPPLLERDPVLFWKGLCCLLLLMIALLLIERRPAASERNAVSAHPAESAFTILFHQPSPQSNPDHAKPGNGLALTSTQPSTYCYV